MTKYIIELDDEEFDLVDIVIGRFSFRRVDDQGSIEDRLLAGILEQILDQARAGSWYDHDIGGEG